MATGAIGLFDALANQMGLIRCESQPLQSEF
jgi:hypothetical protein